MIEIKNMSFDKSKALKKIIIHAWDTIRVYAVHHRKELVINKNLKFVESDFEIELSCIEDLGEDKIWEINKKNVKIKNVDLENETLRLLSCLEDYTYPVQIKVDQCGNFIEVMNHKEWTENWRSKAKKLAIEEYDVNGNLEVFQKFYEVILNQRKFIENRAKEAYWNLLFINFRIAVPIDKNYTTDQACYWDLAVVGRQEIKGHNSTDLVNDNFVMNFKAHDNLDKHLIERIVDRYGLEKGADFFSSKMNATIDVEIENETRKLNYKSALIEFNVENQFSYSENITIKFSTEIEK